ncbi:hypothetical protein [Roseospira visakhapatnamensis]|uniref:Uncharacterized protein n=1 Tax=Roseospira visakhapatnamensis TaxID=390880 RepID=A0A7W6W8V6_9PROT|nr:hypothetical protein [Roseospira visakhapatnamensis]MBB4265430.1 hypothetical protein [Roseospira visakhapatnamensis]
MPLGRPRRRRRSGRPVLVLLLTLVALGVLGAGLWYGHRVLSHDLHVRIATLEARVTDLSHDLERTARTRDRLAETLEETQAQLRYTEMQYEREVPDGDARRLLDLVREGLARGADPDRLAFMIEAGARPMRCDETPSTDLLAVAHPGRRRAAGAIRVADGRVTVTAEGATATDERDRPEDWFDVDRPVRVRFAQGGLAPTVVEGKLPLTHKVISGEAEYRFAIAAARRGYMEISVTRCAFP